MNTPKNADCTGSPGPAYASAFSIFFGIAWAVGAVLEGVPRAASMGLLMFGLGGIVILTVTIRFITGQNQ